jgi:hypothetical protein
MFDINVKKLTVDKNKFGDIIFVRTSNLAAERLAKLLAEKLKDKKCPDHPDARQVITLTADRKRIVISDKTTFCCKKFKDSIGIDIK